VQDVKCTLNFIWEDARNNPRKAPENMKWAIEALHEEKENKNRTTVVKMIESLYKRIYKLKIPTT